MLRGPHGKEQDQSSADSQQEIEALSPRLQALNSANKSVSFFNWASDKTANPANNLTAAL